jgi:sugar phosphate isomerase/epimerase
MGFAGLVFDARSRELDLTQLTQSGRREFLRVLSSNDLQLAGLAVDLGAKGLAAGADVDRCIAHLDRVMEAAAGLQAPLLCVDLGPLPEPPRSPKPRPKITPEQAGLIIIPGASEAPVSRDPCPEIPPADPSWVGQVEAALVEIGARADRYSVTLAFSSTLSSFAALHTALVRARCPWFGVDLDPVGILRDEMERDGVFSLLGPLLRHIRGRDASVGADRRTKPAVVGHGSTDWSEFLAVLDEAGYAGWLTVDPIDLPDRPAAASAALKHLRPPPR